MSTKALAFTEYIYIVVYIMHSNIYDLFLFTIYISVRSVGQVDV